MSKKYQKDSLGNRMKNYEGVTRTFLPQNLPIIIRLDGVSFHSFTKKMDKPFDKTLLEVFNETCLFLAKNVGGVKIVYHQSDEISLLLRNDDSIKTQAWFNNNFSKLLSVTASMATAKFNEEIQKRTPGCQLAYFDARAFILPEHEIVNYFIWRQQDAMSNSVSMVAQTLFSPSILNKKTKDKMIDMMKNEKNVDFYKDYQTNQQRGSFYLKEFFTLPINLREKEKISLKDTIRLTSYAKETIEQNLTNNEVLRSRWISLKNTPILTEEKWLINQFTK